MRFESGPVGAQNVEIRVTDTPVEGSQAANTLLTSGDSSEVRVISFKQNFPNKIYFLSQVCGGAGSTVDGVATMDVCCSLKV